MPHPPPVLIFDLDGTILRVNSFPHWAWFLIAGRVPGLSMGRRAMLSWRAQMLLWQRKLGRLDHAGLRRGLRRAWHRAARFQADALADRFSAGLHRHVRPNLQSLLRLVRDGEVDAVLATAAAAEYAIGLGHQLGFRHVLAASSGAGAGRHGSTGQRKRDQVATFLRARGWRDRRLVLLTDHIDDLPLIRDAALVCWFGPERRLVEARAAAGANCVFCRPLDREDVAGTLRAHGVPLPPAAVQAARDTATRPPEARER